MEETPRRIRLTQWAAHNGIPHRIARQMMASGTLPGDLDPIKIGRFWFVRAPDEAPRETVLYARVSSRDQKSDLDRQKLRLLEHAQRERITVDDVVTEIGSGLNGARPKLVRMLERPRLAFVLIEHRERLARFGFEMVDALLRARGGRVIVVDDREVEDDLVRDMTEVLTSLCARLYGRRSAARRAQRALEAARG